MSRAILAWCLYDLANTIFAMNMTSYHFPVWVISDRGGQELWYSLAFGGSMLASSVLMPWIGAESDRKGGRVRGMAVWTTGCVLLTAALSWIPSLPAALVVFALANFCYQLAGVFYNALLPGIAPSGGMGRVSGYGVALGYVGTFIGIVATAPVAARWGRQATFVWTALLFLVMALPSFWLREAEPHQRLGTSSAAGTVPPRSEPSVRKILGPLLPSVFLGLCVVGVAILFMSVYAKQAVGLTDSELQTFLLAATAVTIAASFAWGPVTDRLGGGPALSWAWALWVAVFGLVTASSHRWVFIGAGFLSGIALSGTWISSRVLLAEWVGPARMGEAFGLFGLVSRVAAVVGPVVWASIVWVAAPLGHVRYQLAMAVLFIFALASWVLFSFDRMKKP